MERHQVGTVKELYRYPVKSLLGESLNELSAATEGVIGDRAWALIDETDGRVMSAKKFRTMLGLRAAYDSEPSAEGTIVPRITLPDGRAFLAGDPAAVPALSELLNRKLKLLPIQPAQKTKAGIDPATIFGEVGVKRIFPDLTEETMPPEFGLVRGTFFDSAIIHVLTTGTLAHMRALIGADAHTDARRFRPNI
ncbi:MAG: MOSC N-terminal beta barrel domain-containing protein, partial [Candidatus Binataceae bacterium]